MAGPSAPSRLRRLGLVIPIWAATLAVVVFGAVGGTMYVGAQRAAARQAEVASRQVADLTRGRLEQVMQTGASREVIERAATAILAALSNPSGYVVHLHPSPDDTEGPAAGGSSRLAWVFATGNESYERDGDRYVTYFPVVARQSCLPCHANVAPGALLSVLEVSHDLGPDLAPQRHSLLLLLLTVLPLPLLLALAASRRLGGRLSGAVRVLRDGTRKVARGEDLDEHDLSPELAYLELERVFQEVRGLAVALQETRDLRFQVEALDALVLTAEPVADWRHEVSRVTAALRRGLPVRALVTAFAGSDGSSLVVVFWNGPSTALERAALTGLTQSRWEGAGNAPPDAAFEHLDLPAPTADAPALPDLEACTVTFLGTRVPRVGGITQVGLALASSVAVRPLALRGVLSALQSSVGALHAIDGYLRQIEYHATRDVLTQLPNRRMFSELLTYEIERARRHDYAFAVMVLDLDGFKQVNDTWGHAYGDRFLAAVAEALRGVARTEDVLARYGGDEFVMLASGADAERIRLLGERLLARLATFSIEAPDGTRLGASASLGAAVYPQHGNDPQELFRCADAEMYRAKAAGKGCLRIAGEG